MDILKREPVRAAIYPVVALTAAYLASRGVVDSETKDFVLALTVAILGGAGIEVARSQVSPVDKP